MNTLTVAGSFCTAKIFTACDGASGIEGYAIHQIKNLCDNEASKGSTIRIMPDVHPGKLCTIGLTMTVTKRILPEIVGIDIGCGMTVARIKKIRPEFQRLDTVIRENVPSGGEHRKEIHPLAYEFDAAALRCKSHLRKTEDGLPRFLYGAGTLGGGNHFIEVDKDDEGNAYLVLHSGSRHLGCEVSDRYLLEGYRRLKAAGEDIPYELTYLEGELMWNYIHDVQIVKDFATLNRHIMIREICRGMKWKIEEEWTNCHNYISETENGKLIIRKGAISAEKGERVIIPSNMKDGVILGIGKGNQDWNCSAPHGSGRILKRTDVKKTHTVSEFKRSMKGIYSSCVSKDTLDEAPFAYRPLSEIQEAIQDTVAVEKIIRPVYSFKAGGED